MHKEIEARFLDIDKQRLIKRLATIDAADKGEVLLTEIIFYDKKNTWSDEGRYVRIRSTGDETRITYKHNQAQTIDSAREIEFVIPDIKLAKQFLEAIGLVASRYQEKLRHTFEKDSVTVDIDTWPQVPTYVELEGPSEESIKSVAELLDFKWKDAVFEDARGIIQNHYNIPVTKLRYFTFERME